MWIWIIPLALAFTNFATCAVEISLGNEFDDDATDDGIYYFMDEKPLKRVESNAEDINTRRRSAIGQNYMRFGRNDMYIPQRDVYDMEDLDENEEFMRPIRTYKNSNYSRFGRTNESKLIHIRFGRDTRLQDENKKTKELTKEEYKAMLGGRHIRPGKRTKRDTYAETSEKQVKHSIPNTVRMGRGNGFMRFGRNFYNDDDAAQENSLNQGRSLPTVLLPLLKQLAARLNSEDRYSGYSRSG